MNAVELPIKSMRYYGSKIEHLERSLNNANASLYDSFISGSDRAKLLRINYLKIELKKDIEFIGKTFGN